MQFSVFNPPITPVIPEPEAPSVILPTSLNEKGAVAMVAYAINQDIVPDGEYLPNTLMGGAVIDGGHLRLIAFNYTGAMVKSPQPLSGQWQCLANSIEDGGSSWGLAQRISD